MRGGGGWVVKNPRIDFVSDTIWGVGGGWVVANPRIDLVSNFGMMWYPFVLRTPDTIHL